MKQAVCEVHFEISPKMGNSTSAEVKHKSTFWTTCTLPLFRGSRQTVRLW